MAALPTLLTKRLALEPFETKHAAGLAAALDSSDIQDFTTSWSYPLSLDAAEARLQRGFEAAEQDRGFGFVLVNRETKAIIGAIGGRLTPTQFGYWISKQARQQGFVTEALEAVLSWLFEVKKVDAAFLEAEKGNQVSIKIMERFGFQLVEHVKTSAPNKGGMLMDCERRVLTAEAYFAQKQASGCFGAAQVSQAAKLVLVSAAVLIDRDGRILLAQRPEGKSMAGLWEFPGGKVEPGESPELALCRELKEELGIDVTTSCLAPLTFASHAYETFHLLMPLYAIRVWEGRPESREGQALKWVPLNKLRDYPMPPADVPLVPLLFDLLN